MTTDIGVVVGRFQVANLSEGHVYLIEQARAQHRNVVVLIGSSQEWGTKKNPLNYATRERMVRASYPDVTCCPLPDFPGNNKRWSHHLDVTVKSLGWDVGEAVLYAGRDSFRPHYEGAFKVVECDSGMSHISGTQVRGNVGKLILATEDFRRGVIWATQNPFNVEAVVIRPKGAASETPKPPVEETVPLLPPLPPVGLREAPASVKEAAVPSVTRVSDPNGSSAL